jgi:hypothetical protein
MNIHVSPPVHLCFGAEPFAFYWKKDEGIMPSKGEGRYRHLLDDPQVKRWYDNVDLVYLRFRVLGNEINHTQMGNETDCVTLRLRQAKCRPSPIGPSVTHFTTNVSSQWDFLLHVFSEVALLP